MAEVTESDSVRAFRLIAIIYKSAYRIFSKSLERLEISPLELWIMREAMRGPRPLAELADKFNVTKAAVTYAVDRLESAGMVERVRGSEDRRVISLSLTPKGRSVLRKGDEAFFKIVEQTLSSLSREEVEQLVKLLERVSSRLREIEGASGSEGGRHSSP